MALTISGFNITGNLTAVHIPPPPPTPAYLWGWGANDIGQLGLGNTTSYSSPKQVGALTTWSKISGGFHGLAIKTDGTMWSWGNNGQGRLGLGDTTNRSSPVQVGALTNWSSISAFTSHNLAIKTDGTMWSWGYNVSTGRLGLGNTTNYSSPMQIGALTTWSSISAGYYHTLATKTDGTLWTWGLNSYGSLGILGLGDTDNRSSPTTSSGI